MYSQLPNNSDPQSEDHEILLANTCSPPPHPIPPREISVRNILIATPFLSFALFTLGIWIGSHNQPLNLDYICATRTSKYSPLLDTIPLTPIPTLFNGSLLHPTLYVHASTPAAIDAAWSALGIHYRSLRLPTAQASSSGLTPHTHIRIAAHHGGGYPTNVEGLHHLHCLNLLREAVYYSASYYRARGQGAWVNSAAVVEMHVAHCVDVLRQRLMCVVDTGLMGQVWVGRERPRAFPDFNTRHRCRDFEAVRRWAESRQLPEVVPEDFLVPPGVDDVVYDEIP